MSTALHDVASHATVVASYGPATATSGQNGTAVDLIHGDGPGFALLVVGTLAGGTTAGGKVQESADGSSGWADVVTFTNVTASNTVRAVRFTRTQRYVRGVLTVSGGSPSAAACLVVGQQKKAV